MMKESTIFVAIAGSNYIGTAIDTGVHCSIISITISREVAKVLSGPGWGACWFSGNHDSHSSGWDIADDAWYIVIRDIRNRTNIKFILSTLNYTVIS